MVILLLRNPWMTLAVFSEQLLLGSPRQCLAAWLTVFQASIHFFGFSGNEWIRPSYNLSCFECLSALCHVSGLLKSSQGGLTAGKYIFCHSKLVSTSLPAWPLPPQSTNYACSLHRPSIASKRLDCIRRNRGAMEIPFHLSGKCSPTFSPAETLLKFVLL